jgi:hypothetical protein
MRRYSQLVERHTSQPQRTALRRAITTKLVGAVVLIALSGYAVHGALGSSAHRHRTVSPHHPAAAPIPSLGAAARADALAIIVIGAQCQVFVRDPGGDVLIDRQLTHGESVYYDAPTLAAVVSDASAVKVYINGVLQPAGPVGRQATFTIVKSQPTPTPSSSPSPTLATTPPAP